MSTDDVQTNLRLPAKLKDRLQELAKAAGRTLTAEVVYRLEASLGQPSLRSSDSDAEVWEQLRTLRAQESALIAKRTTLHRLREDLIANAPRNVDGRVADEAREKLYQIDSDVYAIERELDLMSKHMDAVYTRASGMAPGAGRSWS